MYELTKEFRFEAAHHLPDHDGACRNVHGHSWRVRVTLHGLRLHTTGPKTGMLADYGDISAVMKPLIAELDHTDLNIGFANPTSEVLAACIHSRVREKLLALMPDSTYIESEEHYGVKVTVFETDTSSCTYY